MKKITALILCVVLSIGVASCGKGVNLDENEVIAGNGTDKVEKNGVIYTLSNGSIFADGVNICTISSTDNKLFALGEYLYVNTSDGAKQISVSDGKIKKFGTGDILAAKGRWIYYKSDNSKVRGMSLYKVDMIEGRQVLLFEDDVVSTQEIEDGVFLFISPDKTEYVNHVNDDAALYYEEWATEEETIS